MDGYEQESSCYYSTARLWDDGVILPEDTRKVLGLSVLIASNNIQETKHGVFRMWFNANLYRISFLLSICIHFLKFLKLKWISKIQEHKYQIVRWSFSFSFQNSFA